MVAIAKKVYCTFFSTLRKLNRHHHMDLAVMVLVFAPRESRVSQVALDPRDQQVLRDRLVLKDPWAHEETKVTMANQEA